MFRSNSGCILQIKPSPNLIESTPPTGACAVCQFKSKKGGASDKNFLPILFRCYALCYCERYKQGGLETRLFRESASDWNSCRGIEALDSCKESISGGEATSSVNETTLIWEWTTSGNKQSTIFGCNPLTKPLVTRGLWKTEFTVTDLVGKVDTIPMTIYKSH